MEYSNFIRCSLHAGMIFGNFLTEITRVSRLSSGLARDNFLKFPKILSGLFNAHKITISHCSIRTQLQS